MSPTHAPSSPSPKSSEARSVSLRDVVSAQSCSSEAAGGQYPQDFRSCRSTSSEMGPVQVSVVLTRQSSRSLLSPQQHPAVVKSVAQAQCRSALWA
eukprot:CAMPEP_0119334770 /NCGR_PEP_ID=MMETSP1333-20130426/88055_1 /TAXON_ID=418940 /ORGANISM="Scyphosphaera apsteinii, Strain RCC1455" /LENGTH=95 /DNA_ID=CAMNT_0007345151 /DNA_START=86 /DNA_END=374 /DNA_ORIENTATION=+